MQRSGYSIFSAGRIGHLALPNRLVRSATWEPCILTDRVVTDEVLDIYRALAAGGIGMIITGGLPVCDGETLQGGRSYDDMHIDGIGRIVDVVHGAGTGCAVVAQLETGYLNAGPSDIPSPFYKEGLAPLGAHEIHRIVDSFVQATVHIKACGFDGVQLHAAHGGLLSCFLSPYTNRRTDEYGGSLENRARIVREIISEARKAVGDYPILIKMNGTDYLESGVDIETLPALAQEIGKTGVDAIEISGGMWDCLVRPASTLGFRPVPAPESHTRITSPDKQSYFLPYAERLDLDIPLILVGGNRNVERLEAIVRTGAVDFIALCRPLICEPDLPARWLEGRGSSSTACISCNSCIYGQIVHPGRPEPSIATCLFKHDVEQHREAQKWLATWVQENTVA